MFRRTEFGASGEVIGEFGGQKISRSHHTTLFWAMASALPKGSIL